MSMSPGRKATSPQMTLHERIHSVLKSRIVSGQWPPGHRIPFEVDLTAEFGCSRMTMNKVLTQLVSAGLIERRRRAGTFVAAPRVPAAVLDILDIKAEVAAQGLTYGFEVLERRTVAIADSGADWVGRKPDDRLLRLNCLHFGGGNPFCHEERLISLAAVPSAAGESFADITPSAWLLAMTPWTEAEHRIRAEGASRAMAEALDISVGDPCLIIERRTWQAGEPITHVRFTYPGAVREIVARFTP